MSAFKDKFQAITKLDLDGQAKFFKQRFVFTLGDRYWEVDDIKAKFEQFLKNDDGKGNAMSPAVAADFFQKSGRTRTAMQRKAELADVDVNGDGRTSLIEYLVLHFKILILEEFFRRQGASPDVDMSNDGVGLTGVGDRLIEELFAPPQGVDPELEKMMKDFAIQHAKSKQEIAELQAVVEQGGVKGMSAKNSLEALQKKDSTDLNAIEARIAAAIKKTEKKMLEEVAKKEAEAVTKKAEAEASRKGGLADKTGKFGG
jgi:hypothetical protein